MNYLLGTDIGTSGTKTILTDLKGNVLAQDLQETDILTPHPLWAEQWPDVWLNAAKTSIKNTVAKSGVKAEDIKAIAISGLYGGSGIPLDADMKPVRPCMIWMDRRAQKETDWALETIGEQRLLQITHNGADPYYGYTKMLWMKNNEPENWAKTRLFLPPNDYVIYKLTGEVAIDYSSAGNIGGIFDMNTRAWSQELMDAMGIPLSMMPRRLVESTDIVGSEGLIVLPYFMGERSPIWDSDAKGTIVGLSLAHTKAHLYRAFLEAVAYSLRDAMNATGEDLGKSILLAGGVTKSKLWRQIFADVTGYPVVCPKSDVEANMGDVMLAGIGTGLLTYEEVKTWQVLDEPLMPDPARHAQYDRCFEVYKSVYRHLKDDMKTLSVLSQ